MNRCAGSFFLIFFFHFPLLPAYADDQIESGTYDVIFGSWDTDGDKALTPLELSKRREQIFQGFDIDKDGVWSDSEYKVYIGGVSAYREGLPERKARDTALLFKTMQISFLDTDDNNQVEMEEYVSGGNYWFEELDLNKDGLISMEDREISRRLREME